MKKLTLLFVFVNLILTFHLSGQCYSVIQNNSGLTDLNVESILHDSSCALKAILPEYFQNDFGVYSVEQYLHNSLTIDGDDQIELLSENRVNSPYYLLFVTTSSQYLMPEKIKVKINFPEQNEFECLSLTFPNIFQEIENKLNFSSQRLLKSGANTGEVKLAIISEFKELLSEKISCCSDYVSGLKHSNIGCNSCVYDGQDLFERQVQDFFIHDVVEIIEDVDWVDPIELGTTNNNLKRGLFDIPFNIELAFLNGEQFTLDDVKMQFETTQSRDYSDRGLPSQIKSFTFKFPRDCGSYESLWNDYLNDPAPYKNFISIINVDNKTGIIGYHSNINSVEPSALKKKSSDYSSIRQDEINDIAEIRDSSNMACNELIKAALKKYGALAIFSNEDIYDEESFAFAVYNHFSDSYDDAIYKMKIYFAKEFEIVYKDFDDWDECFLFCKLAAKWRTADNLCSDAVHTILDICGAVPVFGVACDLTNAGIYLHEGSTGLAFLSLISAAPIAEIGALGIKYGGKLWKPLTGGCGTGANNRSSVGVFYCRLLSFTVDAFGNIKWKGGRGKLRKLMAAMSDMSGKEAHHVIPWELRKHKFLKILAKKGWHISNPTLNGVPIPSNLHYNHPDYTMVIRNILDEIWKTGKINVDTPTSEVSNWMRKLKDEISIEIQKAISRNVYVNEHFKSVDFLSIYSRIFE